MELFRQLDDGQTDRQTNRLTELFLKSLSIENLIGQKSVGTLRKLQNKYFVC